MEESTAGQIGLVDRFFSFSIHIPLEVPQEAAIQAPVGRTSSTLEEASNWGTTRVPSLFTEGYRPATHTCTSVVLA
jgi:hypothetical protein